MALQPDNERSMDPGFVWGGVGFGPPNPNGSLGFIPSDEELRQQREVEEACERYRRAHPSPLQKPRAVSE